MTHKNWEGKQMALENKLLEPLLESICLDKYSLSYKGKGCLINIYEDDIDVS